MSERIKLNRAVVVEGKYDKITLQNIIDAEIFVTDGFAIFKNKEKCELLRRISKKSGIIVMTDSDSAGTLIRSHLKNICQDGEIINVYIPQLSGKERRKASPSKQGLLGVEGMTADIIRQALARSGVAEQANEKPVKRVTKSDLFSLGLSGCEGAAEKREQLLGALDLPLGLSSNAFLDAVNAIYEYDAFIREVEKWQGH